MAAVTPRSPVVSPFGVNLFGYVTGNLGLGVAARTTATILHTRGVPTVLTDVDPGMGRAGHDTTYAVLTADHADRTPYSVSLFHLNPLELLHRLRSNQAWIDRDRVNASYVAWELPSLPTAWGSILRGLDVALAPSRFVQKAIEDAVAETPCLLYRQAVVIPDDVKADRARWQMPESTVVFVFSFDMASDIERKNPEAVIEAFRQAFGDARRDVQLVIKVNSAPFGGSGTDARFAALVSRIAGDARIRLMTHVLPYREVLSLYASADVLVSLHRSEGFGRSMMEAMSLGRPVVATGWSGNMDYMTTENSFPVDYTLVPVRSDHPAYRPAVVGDGARWAEPSVADCARFMRLLADRPDVRRATGERARHDMLAVKESVESGEIVDALVAAISPGSGLWDRHEARRSHLQRLVRGGVGEQARRRYRALPPGVRAHLDGMKALLDPWR